RRRACLMWADMDIADTLWHLGSVVASACHRQSSAGIIPPGGRTGFNLLLARLEILRITRLLTAPSGHIDKPEPRGQALLAVLAIGAIYLALPRDLVVGPFWLFPTIIVALLVPSVLSHRVGKQSVNRILGIIINGITTLALIASLALL